MDHTKKLAVIPEDLLEALKYNQKQQMGPTGEQLLAIDQDIKSILSRTDLPEDEKVQLYAAALDKYHVIKRRVPGSQPASIPSVQKPSTTLPTTAVDDWEKQISSLLPKYHRNKGTQLYQWMKTNLPDIKITDRGEVEGLPESNIVDLIDEISRSKPRVKAGLPKGFDSFMSRLHEANVPQSLIGNIQHLKKSSIIETPPSSSSKENRSRSKARRTTPFHTPRGRSVAPRRLQWQES